MDIFTRLQLNVQHIIILKCLNSNFVIESEYFTADNFVKKSWH